MAKPKKVKPQQVEVPFHQFLNIFYRQEKKRIMSKYTTMTKKFLNFNNPDNATSFLRPPQYEALEMYIFLKEFCNNKYLYEIFQDWFYKQNEFEGRQDAGVEDSGQMTLLAPIESTKEADKDVFLAAYKQLKKNYGGQNAPYPNYIFALTMGLGKTILMATTIFYEFLLANKYPKDKKYCHNVLIFAPDKTVLQSLREIETFDKSKVVPPEYVNWLETNLKFFFLDESGDALNAIENSKYNIIISNTQKIILKKQHKEKTGAQRLFEEDMKYTALSLNKEYADLYGFDADTEADLIPNQRFHKLARLQQLGIYVDEAHHVFGTKLEQDFDPTKATSLRFTINELAAHLAKAGTQVVGCYNYTGTPYVGKRLLPEVVYTYGLREAINHEYLKKVKISSFENIQDQTLPFVDLVIKEFWDKYSGKRYEGMLPKLAFFASSIEELQKELKPAVEKVLATLGIPITKILVNVGDSKLTTNDDLREFKNLDTPGSDKQFILLVNKGKEGWNCRSLFGVALHREPDSRIFVLQATMRCLRSIGEVQETGLVFLSEENFSTLDNELQDNFKISVGDINNPKDDKQEVEVHLVPPPVKIKLKRVKKLYQLKDKVVSNGVDLKLEEANTEKYRIIRSERSIIDLSRKTSADKDVSYIKDQREFSELTLVAEIARYLNLSPIKIKSVLSSSKQGIQTILTSVNEFNELLYDWIIPKLFTEFYDIDEYEKSDEVEIELVKEPKDPGYYKVRANKNLIANIEDPRYAEFKEKSFHLDNYCFDSNPENQMFWTLLHDNKIEKVWFTGMLTHGQSDFVIHYIDPEVHTVRNYYPDFLVKLKDSSYVILEVKGDDKIDDSIVKAKADYAKQIAVSSGMQYHMIKGSDANKGIGIQ